MDYKVGIVNEANEMMQGIMKNADEFKKSMESISSASRKQAAGLDEISIAIHMVHDLTLSSSEQAPRAAEVTAKLDEGVQACRKSITIAMEYPAHPNELGPDEKTKGMTSTVTNAYIEFDDVA